MIPGATPPPGQPPPPAPMIDLGPGHLLVAEIAAAVAGRPHWVAVGEWLSDLGQHVAGVYRPAPGRPGGYVFGCWVRGATCWWWETDDGAGHSIGGNTGGDLPTPEVTAAAAVAAVEQSAAFAPPAPAPAEQLCRTCGEPLVVNVHAGGWLHRHAPDGFEHPAIPTPARP